MWRDGAFRMTGTVTTAIRLTALHVTGEHRAMKLQGRGVIWQLAGRVPRIVTNAIFPCLLQTVLCVTSIPRATLLLDHAPQVTGIDGAFH
jgi:hypothetical protein